MPETGLARLQGWIQAVITHPCCAKDGLVSPEALIHHPADDAPLLVKSRGGLTAAERLGIYQEMHLPRMRDALATDYPMLLALLGEERFSELVRAYVQAFPSRSYTLNRLGDRLPAFLRSWGPRRGLALRPDLARLELAMTEVFDEEETPPLVAEALARVAPETWPGARLQGIAALRLVPLSTNALAVFEALRRGDDAGAAPKVRSCAVVYRREYGVRRRAVSHAELAFLADVLAGRPLGDAAARLRGRARGLAPELVSSWTSEWIGSGFFRDVHVG